MDDNKKKALSAALLQIEKQFGKGSVMRMGDGSAIPDIEVYSTGSIALDIALGVGGLPRGRVVEIYGPESSGKTTLALTVLAHAQKDNGVAAFIDAEHALDAEVRLYDRLFSEADPDGGGKNFLDCVNPQSLQILQDCKAEQSLLSATAQDHYQFEREGYFCLDSACVSDGEREGKNKGKLVFNRTIGLRDNWQQKK